MTHLPRVKFSLRTLLISFALAGVATYAYVDYGREFERQQTLCNDLVRDLSGQKTIWIDLDCPPYCGNYAHQRAWCSSSGVAPAAWLVCIPAV